MGHGTFIFYRCFLIKLSSSFCVRFMQNISTMNTRNLVRIGDMERKEIKSMPLFHIPLFLFLPKILIYIVLLI